MAERSRTPYLAALEDWLGRMECPYVLPDAAQKRALAETAGKAFDLLIHSAVGPNLLAGLQGRRFPLAAGGGAASRGKRWENWLTRQDVEAMRLWQKVFDESFLATVVVAYRIDGPAHRSQLHDLHAFGGESFAFYALELEEYLRLARPRSRRWQTISVPGSEFSRRCRPLEELLR
jgi:hypothetical protein